MTQLTDELEWDESLGLDEQAEAVQAHVNAQMLAESERTTNSYCGRCESEVWNCGGYQIKREYNYLASETAKNCFALKNTVVTVNAV